MALEAEKLKVLTVTRRAMGVKGAVKTKSQIITYDTKSLSSTAGYSIKDVTVGEKSYKIRTYGKNNLLPNERETLLRKNHLFAPLLNARRKLTVGAGVQLFEKKYIDGDIKLHKIKQTLDIATFFKDTKVNVQLAKAAAEYIKHGGFFVEFVRNLGKGIKSFRIIENTKMRCVVQDDNGFIPYFLHCGNWAKAGKSENGETFNITAIPNYSGEENKQDKFVIYCGDDFFFDGYYYDPIWCGVIEWLDVANQIPKFHSSNMKNGYFMRMQCEYPHDYFRDYSLDWDSLSEEEKKNQYKAEEAKENDFITKVNKFFEGAENAGRTIFTKYEIERELGKEYPGIKFKSIDSNLYDESMLKLQTSATEAITSAAAVHPSIANIATQGKLSSGSEIRNAYNAYIEIHAPFDREIIISNTLGFIHAINNWSDNQCWMFSDVKLETLDANPAGKGDAKPIA